MVLPNMQGSLKIKETIVIACHFLPSALVYTELLLSGPFFLSRPAKPCQKPTPIDETGKI